MFYDIIKFNMSRRCLCNISSNILSRKCKSSDSGTKLCRRNNSDLLVLFGITLTTRRRKSSGRAKNLLPFSISNFSNISLARFFGSRTNSTHRVSDLIFSDAESPFAETEAQTKMAEKRHKDKEPSYHFSDAEIESIVGFVNGASVKELSQILGVSTRQAMCFSTFCESFSEKKCRNLAEIQEGLGFTNFDKFEKVCKQILTLAHFDSNKEQDTVDSENILVKEFNRAKLACAPWPSPDRLRAINSVVSLNLDVHGIRWGLVNVENFELLDAQKIDFTETVPDSKIHEARQFSVAKILDTVRSCVDMIPRADCYILEEKRIKSPSGGHSFIQDRLTLLHGISHACFHFRDKESDVLTLKFGSVATFFEIKKAGTGFADSRKIIGNLLNDKSSIPKSDRCLTCPNIELKEFLMCDEADWRRKKVNPSAMQGISFAILQGLLFGILREYFMK